MYRVDAAVGESLRIESGCVIRIAAEPQEGAIL
jgi:hypothetical protein